jgi:hypothetical protein
MDGVEIERILTDDLTTAFDDRYSNIVFFAPIISRIDAANFELRFAANQRQQFFEHNLAKVTASTRVVMKNLHLAVRRCQPVDD